jgi:4-oxalocrotonate tautomerase
VPLINVHMAEGRTEQQKRALLHEISRAVQAAIGAPEASIRVWITEFKPSEYLAGGEILADRNRPAAG